MLRIDLVSPYVLLWTVFQLLLIISKDNKEHILGRKRKGKRRSGGEVAGKSRRNWTDRKNLLNRREYNQENERESFTGKEFR